MALREILTDKNPKLRKVCRKVDKIDQRLITLLDDMAETLYKAEGFGLAAPQIGVLKRVVVMDVGDGLIELINPEIIKREGEYLDIEGCLSIPGESVYVLRPEKVTVHALDRNGDLMEYEGEDLFARCMCHELDHLEGVLCIDRRIEPTEEQKLEVAKRHNITVEEDETAEEEAEAIAEDTQPM